MASDRPIRLLQVTDMHLQQEPSCLMRGANVEARFQQVIHQIEQENADFLLLTGDLTHHAPPAYDRLSSCLQGLPFPAHWIPGNHDLVDEMARFSDLGYNQKVIVGGDWRIILLDSTSNPDGKGGGALSAEELDFLNTQLAILTSEQHVLVVLHHHPVSVESEWMDQIGLANKDRLWELLAHYSQVKGVVFGHVHQEFQQQRGNVKLLACPATAPQFKPFSVSAVTEDDPRFMGPAYRRIQLYDDGEIQSEVVRLRS
ncbi:phosphodiesterase [Neptuniibacter sp. 1_MG-2023]|uniref:phosphodiesterase n=1 Tax=Neptuniibacter sp. 1_MG-2023 TaxID=3062662 RepID=UPI0026E20F2A|nr:phosphodiesterase [Neptuniibacter sp. 1_MG-2023]MDO6593315.1 phosphodiesterase [Neptuniibacter sp. 1_MG-2023]